MWFRAYKDYPIDTPLIHYPVEPGKGIIGCQMHEINGWGDHIHLSFPKKPGVIKKIICSLLGREQPP